MDEQFCACVARLYLMKGAYYKHNNIQSNVYIDQPIYNIRFVYDVPRVFWVQQDKATQVTRDSCQKSVYSVTMSSTPAGDPETNSNERLKSTSNTRVMSTTHTRQQNEEETLVVNMDTGMVEKRQSSLDILASAAMHCATSDSKQSKMDTNVKDILEDPNKNKESSTVNQKLPSFATLAYNMVLGLQEKCSNTNSFTSGRHSLPKIVSRESKVRRSLANSPSKKKTKIDNNSSSKMVDSHSLLVKQESNENVKISDIPFKSKITDVKQECHQPFRMKEDSEDKENTNSYSSVTERCSPKKSPRKKKSPVKPKIWNPINHVYKPRTAKDGAEVYQKVENVQNLSAMPIVSVKQEQDLNTLANKTPRLPIKHTVESMLRKDNDQTSPENNKRILEDEEPSVKRRKLDSESIMCTPISKVSKIQTGSPVIIPNQEIKQEFPMKTHNVEASPLSSFLSRTHDISPRAYIDLNLRPMLSPLSRCNFSPFSPAFGRADNIGTPESFRSPIQSLQRNPTFQNQVIADTNTSENQEKSVSFHPVQPTSVFLPSHLQHTPLSRPMLSTLKNNDGKMSFPKLIAPKLMEGSQNNENMPLSTLEKDMRYKGNVELVNGGFGIKNPSFRPPKPSDITNIQQDTETGRGKYVCKVCQKEFGLQRLLNRHLKCHSDVKRYLCTFCGKGFNDTFDLKRHTRIHTGVKPYSCSECDRSFTQRCSLESHCRKVHNIELKYEYKQRRDKIYVCEECGHSTQDPGKHYIHLRENHPNNPALAKCHDKRQFKFSPDISHNIHRPRT